VSGRGAGSDLRIQARIIELRNGAAMAARSSGSGDAGSIVIQAGEIFRSQGGTVTTEAERGDGGNIQLTAGSLAHLRDSLITTSIRGEVGNVTSTARGGGILPSSRGLSR